MMSTAKKPTKPTPKATAAKTPAKKPDAKGKAVQAPKAPPKATSAKSAPAATTGLKPTPAWPFPESGAEAASSPAPSGLGLDRVGNLADLLKKPKAEDVGKPVEVDVTLIDEDPDQPRTADNPGFTPESIAELAASINPKKGLKTPISLRQHPEIPGRHMINHGARRLRATIFKGMPTIKAFFDNDYSRADQVIENLQRNDLTAREIADFIGRELAAGKKKGEIADEIGKSPAFVTQHVTLLDLPEPIADVFNDGRVRDVTVINELVKAHKENAEQVERWLANDDQEVTRSSVKLLREFLDSKDQGGGGRDPDTLDAFTGRTDGEGRQTSGEGGGGSSNESGTSTAGQGNDNSSAGDKKAPKEKKEPDPDKFKRAIVKVEHQGRSARILLDRRPPAAGFAWLKYDDDGHEFEAGLTEVKLMELVEG